jgi:hypothetical protein
LMQPLASADIAAAASASDNAHPNNKAFMSAAPAACFVPPAMWVRPSAKQEAADRLIRRLADMMRSAA